MKRIFILVMVAVLAFSFAGCGRGPAKIEGNKGLTIYTSFYPMYFLASQIAGDKAKVISLVPAGVEPHDWEPKPRTFAELQGADMFIYNGAGMETWVENVLPTLQKSGVRIVEASKGLELIPGDPHVWVSPEKYKQQAANIYNEICALDPANKEYYKANYDKLAKDLDKLDNDFKQAAAGFKSKVFVVSHAAFGYLAADYGLTQLAIKGVASEAETLPRDLGELARICKENNVKYIFFESLLSPKLSEILSSEVGAGTLVLNNAEGVTEEEAKQGKNYITIMYQNLENLKKALM